jgi:phage-related baseplate assembly protein
MPATISTIQALTAEATIADQTADLLASMPKLARDYRSKAQALRMEAKRLTRQTAETERIVRR